VQAVELWGSGSRLYLGGHFGLTYRRQRVCGRNVRGLVSVRPGTGKPFCDWLPRLAPFSANYNGPWVILAVGNRLWVGGGWGSIGGRRQSNLALFMPKSR
jgi:hypothetical protein